MTSASHTVYVSPMAHSRTTSTTNNNHNNLIRIAPECQRLQIGVVMAVIATRRSHFKDLFGIKSVACLLVQELIRRWDSERELFYDDIVHVEASAYAHW